MLLSIEPYSGVGEVKFGMNKKEVKRIAGTPELSCSIEKMTNETRHDVGFHYDSGKLACITVDSHALIRNTVKINEEQFGYGLLENLQLLNRLTTRQVKVRNLGMYIYPELGVVFFKRKTLDYYLAKPQISHNYVLAICSDAILKEFYNYSLEKEPEEETFDSTMFDTIETILQKKK